MGSFANTLFTIMLGWVQNGVSALWSAFSKPENDSLLGWVGHHWILAAVILCAVGAIADFVIYLVRWQPYKVWKSFFHRKKEYQYEETETAQIPARDSSERFQASADEEGETVRSKAIAPALNTEKEDPAASLKRWETEVEEPEQMTVVEKKVTVTSAGYSVPEDSPYRRPVSASVQMKQTAMREIPRDNESSAPVSTDFRPAPENLRTPMDNPDARLIRPRRRRRINVGELFSDNGNDVYDFDAPQNLIDSQKAYHQPVYPREWKGNRGDQKHE